MNPVMMLRLPRVKLRANLDGERMITGRNSMNAIIKKTAPAAINEKKYTSPWPLGILRAM